VKRAVQPALDEQAASAEETRLGLLAAQRRPGPAIRGSFIQERGGQRRPGPLALFVKERRLFALQLYLLLHCLALRDPWDVYLPAAVWARALDHTGPGAEGTVSRSWQWLRENKLVRTEREQRLLRVYLLEENGSGEQYTQSTDFFRLPLNFFRDGWYAKLNLPATAVLLIALNLSRTKVWFELRTERAAGWFDISADTLQRGLDQLRDVGLLEVHQRQVKDIRARYGVTAINEYRLMEPFATIQVEAKKRPARKAKRRRKKA
jgi:DNA-binding transcriptional ArsR family regulator